MKDKIQLIRESAEADLATFIRLVAPHLVLGSVHQELISWWNRSEAKKNQLVLLPRGHLKSKLAAYRVAWYITKHPETTILYVSATADLAEKQLFQIKQILDSPIYRRYWPEMIGPDEGKREKWAVAEIAVDHPKRKSEGIRDATCKAVGLTSNTTGFHADIVVLDDIVVPGNAYTEEGRDKVSSAYSQLASIENPGAEEWVVGTRYHPKDIYQTMIEMKAEIFNPDTGDLESEEEIYELFQRVVETNNEFLWPRQLRADGKSFGFDYKILAAIKGKYVDSTQFYSQYYNNPNNSDTARINNDKFQYYERSLLLSKEGDWYIRDRKLNVYAAIDFAFSLSKKADYTAVVVIGVDYLGNYYVLDIDRFKTNRIIDYYTHILSAQQKWGFRKIRAEVTVAQEAIVEELKDSYIKPNGVPLSVDKVRPNRHEGDKEERVNTILEPKYDNMQVWHYRGGNCQSLEEELIMLHPPHDDIKDALANAIAISQIPRQRSTMVGTSNVITHSRFGGVSF
ncbi:terminase large subunit [Caudoviricetes sp.]|nr:terminase large subunit [Caudoviricetes sp.]